MDNKKIHELYFVAILLVVLLFFGIFYDASIYRYLSDMSSITLTYIMTIFTYLGAWHILLILITVFFIQKRKNLILPFWLSLFLSLGIIYGLKLLFYRERPIAAEDMGIFASSFPSGHAAGVFSPVVILWKNFTRFRYIWIGFAFLVLLSRIYLGAHYMSDVAAGALIALLIGIGVDRFFRNKEI